MIRKFLKKHRGGTTLFEGSLIAVLIAVVLVFAFKATGVLQ